MKRIRSSLWKSIRAEFDPRSDGKKSRRVYPSRLFPFWIALICLCLLLGYFMKVGGTLAFAMILYSAISYLKIRASAQGMTIARKAPARLFEHDWLEVQYEIVNPTAFSLHHFTCFDYFTGTQEEVVEVLQRAEFRPFSFETCTFRLPCDGGMGNKSLGPIRILFSDSLGLFEFEIIEEQVQTIEVFPRVEAIPIVPLQGGQDSYLYGVYDVQSRGTSVNFSGIRDYVSGDSLRHVAWRLSMRHNHLVVKEFERSVNSDVTIALNMEGREHVGRRADSTWEYAKDLALALVTQQTALGNGIQFVSGETLLPFSNGVGHAQQIALKIFELKPTIHDPPLDLIKRYRDFMPRGSAFVYITPIFGSRLVDNFDSFLWLKAKGVNCHCILLDASSFLGFNVSSDFRMVMEAGIQTSKKNLASAVERFQKAEIPIFVIRFGSPLGLQLLGITPQAQAEEQPRAT